MPSSFQVGHSEWREHSLHAHCAAFRVPPPALKVSTPRTLTRRRRGTPAPRSLFPPAKTAVAFHKSLVTLNKNTLILRWGALAHDAFIRASEEAQVDLVRAMRRELQRQTCSGSGGTGGSNTSTSGRESTTTTMSTTDGRTGPRLHAVTATLGDDLFLPPEFAAATEAAQRAFARAVSHEVEDQLTDVLTCLGQESAKVEAGPHRYCSPHHPTHLEPSFLESNGITCRGEHYLPGPKRRC